MIPEHCREVGVKKVDFDLTEDEIKRRLQDQKLYTATKYLILNNGDDWAVCHITKEDGFELFRIVTDLKLISTPAETKYVEDPKVDVLNPSKLVAKAEDVSGESGAKTVIVKGEFDHISFASEEKRTPVVVLETVPPNPPKLLSLTERVIEDGKLEKPVRLIPEYIKIEEMAKGVEADTVIFPCRTSGLDSPGRATKYLDELPPLSELTGEVVLLGCSLSDRIFKSHYHRKPKFVNICPADLVTEFQSKYEGMPILLKCCKYKNEFEIEGNIIKVPWGTTTRIIESALNDFFSKKKGVAE